MFKKIYQWITRNTFNGRFHDYYADLTEEEHQALIDQNERDIEYMINQHEENLACMALEHDHEEAILENKMRNYEAEAFDEYLADLEDN